MGWLEKTWEKHRKTWGIIWENIETYEKTWEKR
jgi:hypothetical protein